MIKGPLQLLRKPITHLLVAASPPQGCTSSSGKMQLSHQLVQVQPEQVQKAQQTQLCRTNVLLRCCLKRSA